MHESGAGTPEDRGEQEPDDGAGDAREEVHRAVKNPEYVCACEEHRPRRLEAHEDEERVVSGAGPGIHVTARANEEGGEAELGHGGQRHEREQVRMRGSAGCDTTGPHLGRAWRGIERGDGRSR